MVDPKQFHDYIIKTTLGFMGDEDPASGPLLLGLVMLESNLTYLVQHNNGPALGFPQMEPTTYVSNLVDIVNRRPRLKRMAEKLRIINSEHLEATMPELVTNPMYAIFMARVHFMRFKEPLPAADDAQGLANYHKKYYNTERGHTDPKKSVVHFQKAIDIIGA